MSRGMHYTNVAYNLGVGGENAVHLPRGVAWGGRGERIVKDTQGEKREISDGGENGKAMAIR